MNKPNKIIVSILSALPAVILAAAAVIYSGGRAKSPTEPFKAPPFEAQAAEGVPDTGRGDYRELKISEDFIISLCTELNLENGGAEIYFTSHKENSAYLRLMLSDSAGNELFSSGLIKPGEYLKTAELKSIPSQSGKITAKILSYEPGTYYSAGTAAAEIYLKIK